MKLSNRYKIVKGPNKWYLIRIGLINFCTYDTLDELIDTFYTPLYYFNNVLVDGVELNRNATHLYYQIYHYPQIISFDRRTTKETLKKKLIEYLI